MRYIFKMNYHILILEKVSLMYCYHCYVAYHWLFRVLSFKQLCDVVCGMCYVLQITINSMNVDPNNNNTDSNNCYYWLLFLQTSQKSTQRL